MKPAVTILFICLLSVSCKKSGCLEEAGSVVSTTRSSGRISEIRLYDNIHLYLKQDTATSIRVEAGLNLEPFIETSFEGTTLTIRNNIQCSWIRDPDEKINVYVSVVQLEKLLYEGSGNVQSVNTIKADNINFYSELGAGNIEIWLEARQTFSYLMDENADFIFHGKTDAMWSYTNSRGTIDFSDFEVKKMVIEYGGVRDARIWVTEELNSIIYYHGNLLYKGDPLITQNTVHSGGRLLRIP